MRTIDSIIRRKWTDSEKEFLTSSWISNWAWWAGWIKFTDVARNIIQSIIIYFPNLNIEKVDKYLIDLDRLANECHDPDYFEWNNFFLKFLADFRFAKWVYILTWWTSFWIRILIFLIILVWLWKCGWKYYNYGDKKDINLLIKEKWNPTELI